MTKRKAAAPNKGGRPTTPNKAEIFAAVCERIAEGELVVEACKAEGVGTRTFLAWSTEDGLQQVYVRAREAAADALADEALQVARGAKNETAQADRLLVDTLKWTAAKRRPRYYSDKMDLTSDGEKLSGVVILPPTAE
jgi:hypothetical protein